MPGAKFPIDDDTEWVENGTYYTIVKDNQDKILKQGIGSLLYESEDGVNWKLIPEPYLQGVSLTWEDGRTEKYSRLEMPKIIWNKGKMETIAFAARAVDENELSFNIQIPLVEYNEREN